MVFLNFKFSLTLFDGALHVADGGVGNLDLQGVGGQELGDAVDEQGLHLVLALVGIGGQRGFEFGGVEGASALGALANERNTFGELHIALLVESVDELERAHLQAHAQALVAATQPVAARRLLGGQRHAADGQQTHDTGDPVHCFDQTDATIGLIGSFIPLVWGRRERSQNMSQEGGRGKAQEAPAPRGAASTFSPGPSTTLLLSAYTGAR